MKPFLMKSFFVILAGLNFIQAEGIIPKLKFQMSNTEIGAIIALVVALILVLIYWILQAKLRGIE